MEPGKLFVGGISWDTNEDRLRDYFQTFGEVVEAVIMKDRATGRARGFGFVIYADPAVAELVVRQKHIIDGRAVEAKKAVPRDDQQHILLARNQSSPTASPPVGVGTKKIFVGGLPSTITEADFKGYFDQFGIITDVVVMYDHNTQRPRGFGFITFDSEEAVERTLIKKFHQLNGKLVEVKRAVPKELSPCQPNRSLSLSLSSSISSSRVNNFISGFGQGFSIPGHGIVGIEERHSPLSFVRSGLIPFNNSANYGTTMNYERRISPPSYGEAPNNVFPNLGGYKYEQGFNGMLQSGNVSRSGVLGDNGVNSVSNPNSSSWSLWGNGNGNMNEPDGLRSRGEAIWGSGARASLTTTNVDPSLSAVGPYGRSLGRRTEAPPAQSSSASLFGYSEEPWSAPSMGIGTGSFEFGLGNGVTDVQLNNNNPAALCW